MPRSTTIVAATLWACVAVLSACVDSDAVHCDDGRLCPSGTICVDDLDLCAHPDQLGDCTVDGTDCEFLGTNGICRGEVCVAEGCGDSFVTGSEACDPERALAATEDECGEHGFQQGDVVACNLDCTWDFSDCQGICGDHVVDPGEECDLPDLGEHDDCQDLGYYDSVELTCTAACRYDRTLCTGFCGDGERNGSEACDQSDLDEVDCEDLGYYFPDGLACTPLCGFNTIDCTGFCGDGEVNDASELCDGSVPAAGSCYSFGFDAGTLGCSPFCTPGFDPCARLGWEQIEIEGGGAWFYGVWAIAPDDVIVVGQGGAIARHDGIGWITESSGVTTDLLAVTGAGADLYAVGRGGVILRRSGGTWSAVVSPTSGDLEAVWASSAADVVAVGPAGIVRFDGSDWTLSPAPGGATLRAVHGVASDDVYAVGDGGAIVHYDGTGWSTQTSPTGDDLLAVRAIAPSALWVAGGSGTVLHHDGAVWTPISIPGFDNAGPRGIWASGPRDVYVIGEGGVRFDGTDWWFVDAIDNGLEDVSGSGPGHVVALDGVHIDVFEGSGWGYVAPPGLLTTGAWGTSASDFFAVGYDGGSQGRLARFDGLSWSPVTLPTSVPLSSIWGADPSDIFVAGTQGTIVHYDGSSWQQETTSTTFTIAGLWGAGPAQVFAVRSQVFANEVLSSTAGGAWTGTGLPTSVIITYAIWGSGPDDVWAAGSPTYHHDGTSWQPVTLPFAGGATEMWGSGPDDLWALNSSSLVHYDGSSWTWHDVEWGEDQPSVIWGYGPDDVFVGAGTALFHYDGARWTQVRLPATSMNIGAIWGTPQHTYFLDGGGTGNAARLQRTVPWSCRASETGCGDGMDDDCDGSIDGADADCDGALAFLELHGALTASEPDYIEIVNRTSRTSNLSGISIGHRGSCGAWTYTFPSDAIVGPGQTYRVVDADSAGEYARERSSDADLCDEPTAGGWFALCAGPCDLAACSNVLDYVEKAGVTAPVSPPACASFTPAPIDVTLVSSSQSPTRVAFTGGTATDWTIADASRD